MRWIGHAPSLLEAGALYGGAERLGTFPPGDVDEPEVGVRQDAAMQPRVEVSGLTAQVVAGGIPGRDELLVRTCGTSKGLISTTALSDVPAGSSSRTTS